MTERQLRERVDSFPVWHYEFDLGHGVRTPIRKQRDINRVLQRKAYAFDSFVGLLGGSLQGKRVLDLGCNAGYWSLAAIEAGADFVLGVDGRQMHIDQSRLVFEAKGIDPVKYDFLRANIFSVDYSRYAAFDVVLCFGLLYHVSRPVELFEVISAINSDMLIVDTEVTPMPGSWIRVRLEGLDEPRNAVDHEMIFCPTRRVVLELARTSGYRAVVLKPEIDDYTNMEDYRIGRRRAFICAKQTDLSSLAADSDNTWPRPYAEARGWYNRKIRHSGWTT